MPIFNINKSKLEIIKEKDIDLEKNIQKLTEENIKLIFGLEFVVSEFALSNFRLDTVAFNNETNSFVIVEYKRDKSFSVIDQGYAYLSLMLNNKADFVLEYNQQKNKNLKKDDIDWSQSRVLFVAQKFTTYQQNAINFKDLPIELWEVKMFDNSTILYNQLTSSTSSDSVKTITKNKIIQNVAKEVTVFTVEDHMTKLDEDTKNIFSDLRERVLNLGSNIAEVPRKLYVAYKTSTNFADIVFYKGQIRVTLNLKSGELNDPRNLAIDFTKPKKGHWGNGDYEISVRTTDDILYAMDLIEQAYKKSIS